MNQSNSITRYPANTTRNTTDQRKRRNDRLRTSTENHNQNAKRSKNGGAEDPITLSSSDEDDEVLYEGTFYNPPNENTIISNKENNDVQVSVSAPSAIVLSGILSPHIPAKTQRRLSMTPPLSEIQQPVLKELSARSSLRNTPSAQPVNVARSNKSKSVEEPVSERQHVNTENNEIEEDELENVEFDNELSTSSASISFVQNKNRGRHMKKSEKTAKTEEILAKKKATEERQKWLAENFRKRQPLLKAKNNNVPGALKKLQEFDAQCDQENRNRLRKREYEAERLGAIGVERKSSMNANIPIVYSIDKPLEMRVDEERRKMSKETIKKQVEMLIGWNPRKENFIRFAFSEIIKAVDATFKTYSPFSLFFAELAQKVDENPNESAFPAASVDDTVHQVERLLRQYPGKSKLVDSAVFIFARKFDAKRNYKCLADLYNHLAED